MIRAHRKMQIECAAAARKYHLGYQEGYICGFLEGTVLKPPQGSYSPNQLSFGKHIEGN